MTASVQRIFETMNLRKLLEESTLRGRARRAGLALLGKVLARLFPHMDANIARILWKKRWWRKLGNLLLIEFQAGLRTTRVAGKPYWLTIDPTNFCQLRCPFCPTGAERKVRAKAILKLEDFKRVLDELGPTLLHIDFMNWGEPLLHRDIFDMVAYAKKFDVDTHISTNFNEFDAAAAERMVLSGLDAVTLSIDGLTQETYAKYRVRGDFNKVMANIRLLVETKKRLGRRNPYVIWQFLVFKHNEHEVEAVRRVGKEMGADVVGVTPAFLPFRPGIKDEWLPLKPEHRYYDPETFPDRPPWEWEAGKPGETAANGAAEAPAGDKIRAAAEELAREAGPAAPAPGDSPVIDVKVYKEPEKRPLCTWPWAGLTVNPNGSASPCCSVEEDVYDFGNLLKDGFKTLWNNANYNRSRRHVRDYVDHKVDVKTRSEHACERCFTIGRANFTFQPWWRYEQYDWWWGIDGAERPAAEETR